MCLWQWELGEDQERLKAAGACGDGCSEVPPKLSKEVQLNTTDGGEAWGGNVSLGRSSERRLEYKLFQYFIFIVSRVREIEREIERKTYSRDRGEGPGGEGVCV